MPEQKKKQNQIQIIQQTIVVRSRFQAVHSWPGCPFEEVSFLRNPHRHEFHVEAEFLIAEDRQKEFFMIKKELNNVLIEFYEGKDLGSKSCETIALELAFEMSERIGDVARISVFEDGENGAHVYC